MKKLFGFMLAALLLLCCCTGCGQKPVPDAGKDNDVSIGTGVDESSDPLPDEDVNNTTSEVTDSTTAEAVEDTTTTSTDRTTTEAADDTTTESKTTASTIESKTTIKTTTTVTVTNKDTKATTTVTTTKATTATVDTTTKTEATTTKTTTPTSSTSRTKKTVTVKSTTTTTTATPAEEKSIRILAVGNSFSVDAMKNHLFQILESAGYTNIVLGNLYIGGCSLNTHWSNVGTMTSAYTYYSNNSGTWKTTDNVDITRGVCNGTWDIITVQQASPDSGKPNSYANLSKLVNWIRAQQPRAKVYFHMTWAYQQDSTHSSFPNYNSDQMTMYNAICTTVQSKVVGTEGIVGVIPCGTTIQNLRTSSLGDTLTADGYHLKDSYGDYAAALTWYCYLLNGSPDDVSYRPYSIEGHFDEIAQSVENAIKTPYKVTPCTG